MIEWNLDESIDICLQNLKVKISGMEYNEEAIKVEKDQLFFKGVKDMASRQLFLAKHVIPNMQFENYELASDLIIDNVMMHLAYLLEDIVDSERDSFVPVED